MRKNLGKDLETKTKITISTKAGTLILSVYALIILYAAIFMGLFR